ncbi:MAG: hypothetical protein D6683_01395 [Actinomyces sp.]|nr:MAG: hypothetical protein D6683_01395 [Actinomyces sp.]
MATGAVCAIMGAMPDSDLVLDDETTAALTLFNEYLAADRERQQRERRLAKAEKAKDEAAAALRALEKKGVTGEEKARAEAAYREALETWKILRDGGEPEPATAAAGDEAPTDESATDETADDEATADEATDADATDA